MILRIFFRTHGRGPAWKRLNAILDTAVPWTDADWRRLAHERIDRISRQGNTRAMMFAAVAAIVALALVNMPNRSDDVLDLLWPDTYAPVTLEHS